MGLILSAGDLDAAYIEFLVTMLNVPLVYVRGNHDGSYENAPPEGCIAADGKIIEVKCPKTGGVKGYKLGEEGLRTVRILGLGGSMRYKYGAEDMYTEQEMTRRVMKAGISLAADKLRGKDGFDILLTHSPCKGYGDMTDLPHTGFECFNKLLERCRPKYHVYGHVHKEYGGDSYSRDKVAGVAMASASEAENGIIGYRQSIEHPSGTTLINASGYQLIEI